ncbi:hypothetical protein LguiB_000199 [Lonicera macranthoides]
MASGKDKKKSGNATETTPKLSLSGKKTPKSLNPGSKVVKKSLNKNSGQGKEVETPQIQARTEDEENKLESGNQESSKSERRSEGNLNSAHENKEKGLNTIASGENKEKSGNPTATTAQLSSSGKKTPHSLKPKHKIVKKSLSQNSARGREVKSIAQAKRSEGNLSSPHGKKEKKFYNETSKRDGKAEDNASGLILMCNAKTKPDCFHYQVMGVPTNKQQLVMGIKPGLKLFLFDFDLKLLYGIYEASSAGGMKLEPAAFGGAFPVQVRFKVLKECLPLPMSVFKKAIKDIYDEKTRKFKTELSIEQVGKLTALFQPASYLLLNAQSSSVQEPLMAIKPAQKAHDRQSIRDPYLSSKPECNLKLSDRHENKQFLNNPVYPIAETASPPPLFLSEKEYRNYGLRGERQSKSTAPVDHNSDPYRPLNPDAFLTEKEYRTYGLRGRYEQPRPMSPPVEKNRSLDNYQRDPYNPYDDSTTSLVDRYLSLPRAVAAPPESYVNGYNYMERGSQNHQGGLVQDGQETLYSRYPSGGISDYNEKYHNLGGETEANFAPVSARYSFAGPSVSYSFR